MIGIVITATGQLRNVIAAAEDADKEDMTGCELLELPADYDPIAVNYVVVDGVAVANPEPTVLLIKAEAERLIMAASPLWRQINDLYEPTSSGAISRRAVVDALRDWSNAQEAKARAGLPLDPPPGE